MNSQPSPLDAFRLEYELLRSEGAYIIQRGQRRFLRLYRYNRGVVEPQWLRRSRQVLTSIIYLSRRTKT
jgi:hypothetical protein